MKITCNTIFTLSGGKYIMNNHDTLTKRNNYTGNVEHEAVVEIIPPSEVQAPTDVTGEESVVLVANVCCLILSARIHSEDQ